MPTHQVAPYTDDERRAMNRAQNLVREALDNDSIPKELFDRLLQNHSDIVTICAEARAARTRLLNKKLFSKKK